MATVKERANIPPPPTLTGDQATDFYHAYNWLWDFYRSGVLEGALFPTVGNFTIEDTDTQAQVELAKREPDENYVVLITPQGKSGAPVADSALVESITKARETFTVALVAAPGSGASRSFAWQLIRQE